MTQVSRYPVHKAVEQRMFEIFQTSISSLRDRDEIKEFLDDFLSPVEKIMLAKRLSIAVLIAKGYTYPIIANILRVTPSTIASVSIALKYAGKGYKKAVNRILLDERISAFWQNIEDVLAKIPPSKGTNMSRLRREYEKEKQRKRKAF